MDPLITSDATRVLPLELDQKYPVIVRGDGAWVEDSAGRRFLDAMSGGSMAATLGHGRRDIIAAARAQAERLAYVHNAVYASESPINNVTWSLEIEVQFYLLAPLLASVFLIHSFTTSGLSD